MKNLVISFIIFLSASFCLGQQFTNLYSDYLGQTPPGDVPVIFAPGIVSGASLEHSATVFSSDGNEVYWASRKDQNDKISTWYMKRMNNRWTDERTDMDVYWVSTSIIEKLRAEINKKK